MSDIPDDILATALDTYERACRHTNQTEIIARAILAERERCIEAAKATGNFGDYRRDELTADYGQPRFDMMNEIISAITNPHSLPSSSQAADKPHGVSSPAPCGTPNPAGEP